MKPGVRYAQVEATGLQAWFSLVVEIVNHMKVSGCTA
jgi:hypothetical protein